MKISISILLFTICTLRFELLPPPNEEEEKITLDKLNIMYDVLQVPTHVKTDPEIGMEFCEPYNLGKCSIYMELTIMNPIFHIAQELFYKFSIFQKHTT